MFTLLKKLFSPAPPATQPSIRLGATASAVIITDGQQTIQVTRAQANRMAAHLPSMAKLSERMEAEG